MAGTSGTDRGNGKDVWLQCGFGDVNSAADVYGLHVGANVETIVNCREVSKNGEAVYCNDCNAGLCMDYSI